jgi:hypothetical protein
MCEPSWRIVPCEACGTEGCNRLLSGDGDCCICRYQGARPEGCPEGCISCDGTGGALIATEPVDLDDIQSPEISPPLVLYQFAADTLLITQQAAHPA